MNPLLIILNPRRIQRAMDAFSVLSIPRAHVCGYTELELVPVIDEIIKKTDYSHYLIVSDDVVLSDRTLEILIDELDQYPVVTAWCNLDSTSPLVNVCKSPLTTMNPSISSYDFYDYKEILSYPSEIVPTSFAGMAPQGMSRDLWLRFPFDTYGSGWAADYHQAFRLQKEGIPIITTRNAFTFHLKETWNEPDQNPEMKLYLGPEHQGVWFV